MLTDEQIIVNTLATLRSNIASEVRRGKRGDCVGRALALREYIAEWKVVETAALLAQVDALIAERLAWLKERNRR